MSASRLRQTIFQPEFVEDLSYWVQHDRKTALKILRMVKEIRKTPFEGIGKPEALKHLAANTWSRRISREHRLVYLVGDDAIDFLQARYHYSK